MSLPLLASIVPQAPPMLLLDELVSHDAEVTTCRTRIGPRVPFADEHGDVPIWIGLEYMAQSAAARNGMRRGASGEPVRVGFLLGSRRIAFHADRFRAGQSLLVRVRDVGVDDELSSLDCEIVDESDGMRLVSGVLIAVSPRDGGVLDKVNSS